MATTYIEKESFAGIVFGIIGILFLIVVISYFARNGWRLPTSWSSLNPMGTTPIAQNPVVLTPTLNNGTRTVGY